MKSARETKLRNFVKDKLSLYSARVSNMNSRNQSNAKCTKTNKIIKHTRFLSSRALSAYVQLLINTSRFIASRVRW